METKQCDCGQHCIAILHGHNGGVNSVALNSVGELVSGGLDNAILYWVPLSADGKHWQVKWRIVDGATLYLDGACIQGAKLSDQNKKLMCQRGANVSKSQPLTSFQKEISNLKLNKEM
eukprot:TRINITY_DN663_c0_g1_i13.p1 TRINITY_DN663_c0_g1~~TRINITY_DN663_c0_g1_i13.p1  ORF type:complete len:118 (-),score=18.33 TRINITY_DN663_c0_g1_i13:232-585(-)